MPLNKETKPNIKHIYLTHARDLNSYYQSVSEWTKVQ